MTRRAASDEVIRYQLPLSVRALHLLNYLFKMYAYKRLLGALR